MTYTALKQLLEDSALFTPAEAHAIVRTTGKYTLGNAIIACQLLEIELSGSDIDVLICPEIE